MKGSRPTRRTKAVWGWGLSVLAAAGAGAVAASWTLAPPDEPAPTTTATSVEVLHGSLGRSVDLLGHASWPLTDLARAAVDGTVTSVDVLPGEEVDVGRTLLTLDLRAVVVARGAVPAFRDLGLGDAGDDVAQLQQMLGDLGTETTDPPGVFGPSTRQAVTSWQRSMSVEPTGTVMAGDLVYVPELPARVLLAEDVTVGQLVSGGDLLLHAVADAPTVTAVLSPTQAGVVPLEGEVQISSGDVVWDGIVAESRVEETGEVSLLVTAPDGSPVCGAGCVDAVPLDPTGAASAVTASMVLVPQTEGPVLPRAALSALADGRAAVTTVDGRRIPVEVVASADGQAVVSGVDLGERVVLARGDE